MHILHNYILHSTCCLQDVNSWSIFHTKKRWFTQNRAFNLHTQKRKKKTNGSENLNTTISRYNGTFVAIWDVSNPDIFLQADKLKKSRQITDTPAIAAPNTIIYKRVYVATTKLKIWKHVFFIYVMYNNRNKNKNILQSVQVPYKYKRTWKTRVNASVEWGIPPSIIYSCASIYLDTLFRGTIICVFLSKSFN